MRTSLLLLILVFSFFQSSFSQSPTPGPDKQWDIEKYKGNTKTFTFNTDEGTCPLLVNMVMAGKKGIKSGEGFYNYANGPKEAVVAAKFSQPML